MNSSTKKEYTTRRCPSPLPMTLKLLVQKFDQKGHKQETHYDKLRKKIRSISMLKHQKTNRGKTQQSVIEKTNQSINKRISTHPLTFTQFQRTAKTPFLSRNKKDLLLKKEITQTNSTSYKTTENLLTKSQLNPNRKNSTPKITPLDISCVSSPIIESIEEYHYNIVKAIQKEKEKVIYFKQLFENEEEPSANGNSIHGKSKRILFTGKLSHRSFRSHFFS